MHPEIKELAYIYTVNALVSSSIAQINAKMQASNLAGCGQVIPDHAQLCPTMCSTRSRCISFSPLFFKEHKTSP